MCNNTKGAFFYFSETRRPVCLPPKAFGVAAGASLTVTGWGYLEENGKKSYTSSHTFFIWHHMSVNLKKENPSWVQSELQLVLMSVINKFIFMIVFKYLFNLFSFDFAINV